MQARSFQLCRINTDNIVCAKKRLAEFKDRIRGRKEEIREETWTCTMQ